MWISDIYVYLKPFCNNNLDIDSEKSPVRPGFDSYFAIGAGTLCCGAGGYG